MYTCGLALAWWGLWVMVGTVGGLFSCWGLAPSGPSDLNLGALDGGVKKYHMSSFKKWQCRRSLSLIPPMSHEFKKRVYRVSLY